jgi:hypothetical protein
MLYTVFRYISLHYSTLSILTIEYEAYFTYSKHHPLPKHTLSHLALQHLYTGYCTEILRRQNTVLLTVRITLQHDKKYTCNNIQTRSYKYCCSEEAISTTYSECVLVVLCIQHGMLHNIFSHFLLKGTIFGKKFRTKIMFLFSLKLLLAACLNCKKN